MSVIANSYRSHPRGIRLCGTCRQDLLAIWTAGFSPQAQAHSTRQSRYLSSRIQIHQRTDQNSRSDWRLVATNSPALHYVREYSLHRDADSVADDLDLAEVERRQSPSEPEDGTNAQTTLPQAHSGLLFDPISLARSRKQSQEDIARLARQKYGEVLPPSLLNEEETKIYIRLYGQAPKTMLEQDELDGMGQDDVANDSDKHTLLNTEGDVIGETPLPSAGTRRSQDEADRDFSDVLSDETRRSSLFEDQMRKGDGSEITSSEGQIEGIAKAVGGEVYEYDNESEDAVEEDEASDDRQHPLTTHGKFQTSPKTVFLPRNEFIRPIEHILGKYSNRQLKEMCERTFGGKTLPNSALTPYSGRTRQQVPIALDAGQHFMGEMEANAFVSAITPAVYASVLSTLTESRKRLGSEWLRGLITKEGGPRVLDVGAGGAGILAWNEIVKAEWANLNGSEAAKASPPPHAKAVVLVGSDTLRRRASALLDNTTFVPRLPDYVHSRNVPTLEDSRPAQGRKQFDVIIASHTLFRLREDFERKQQVQNLWSLLSPDGGVLILLEKGIPRGFEAVAGARQFILDRYIASPGSESYESPLSDSLRQEDQITRKRPGMIVAPCTNHNFCPMYTIPGLSKGRKDFCSFKQRFVRPPFLHRIMEGGHNNFDDVGFSYVVVMKGEDRRTLQSKTGANDPEHDPIMRRKKSAQGFENFTENAVPGQSIRLVGEYGSRLVFSSLKRKGHVSMDVCTPMGSIERWTVPRSFSRQAYHDARKAKWGDIWSLGAKTHVPRHLSLGRSETKEGKKADKKRKNQTDRAEEKRERSEEESLDEQALEKERSEITKQERLRRIMTGETAGSEIRVEDSVVQLPTQREDDIELDDEDEDESLWDDLTPAEREKILAMERELDDEDGDEDDEDDDIDIDIDDDSYPDPRGTVTSADPPSQPRSRKAISDKKLAALEARARAPSVSPPPSASTSTQSTTPSPELEQRLLETLRQEADDDDIERKLKEWEEDFQIDKKAGAAAAAAVATKTSRFIRGRTRLGRSGRRKYK